MNYPFTHTDPTSGSSYKYAGYKKSTTDSLPSEAMVDAPAEYNLGKYTSAAFPKPVYLNYYYKMDSSTAAGEVNIRHMVRTGPTGQYALAKQQTVPIASLPFSHSYSYDDTYGNMQGSNLSYVAYSDTVTVKPSQSVSLTSALSKAYVSFFYEKPVAFTGDFDVLPDNLPYKSSFTLHPKDFQLKGCIYQSHSFKIERNGTWIGNPVYGQTTDSTFTFSSYPWVVGVGTHNVFMRIVTSCGTSDWIGPKPLTVTGPTVNNPPTFQIGFVQQSQATKPLHQVVEGTTLDLIYINDPTVPTPNDPDGDDLYFMGFDFSAGTSFVQSIPSKSLAYTDGQHNLTMDTLGFQYVCAQMRDEFGAAATACTYIEVVPKNPVPVISCPPTVIANHPLPAGSINGNGSYSPMGLKIDHTRDEWTNKQTSYDNPGTTDITVEVSLSVYDENGLKSLEPDTCTIIVKPDLPPIAKLVVPPLSVRDTVLDLLNKSTSPDADPIVSAEYKYKYDANNNGFSDDAWKSAAGTLSKLQFTPAKVGKYLFYLKVAEQYGQWDDTNSDSPTTLTLNVVNNAPEVSFDLEGKNPQPNLDPYTRVQPADMLSWPVYVPGTNNLVYNANNLWRASAGNLISGEGRNFGKQGEEVYLYNMTRFGSTQKRADAYPLTNNGYGSNELNPWRSTLQSTVAANLLYKTGKKLLTYYGGSDGYPKVRSTKKLLFFDHHYTTYSYDYNHQTGTYSYEDEIFALNPKKLSPVVDVFGQWGDVSQKYRDGDPYEFIITNSGPNSYRTVTLSKNGTAYKTSVSLGKLSTYELADQYLYVTRYWKYGSSSAVDEIGIYNARNGQELTSTFNMSVEDQTIIDTSIIMSTQGSSLILMQRNYYNSTVNWYKLSRDLVLTKLASWKPPVPVNTNIASNWQYDGLASMTDAAGNLYRYEGYTNPSYNSGVYDLNVTKYNPDYTLAWRKYIGDEVRNDPSIYGGNLGITAVNSFLSAYSYAETYGGFFFNPAKNELYAKVYYDHTIQGNVIPNLYERVYVLNTSSGAIKRKADSLKGDDLTMYHYGDSDYGFGSATQFSTDFAGNLTQKSRLGQTADGYRTSQDPASGITCDAGSAYYSIYGKLPVYDVAGTRAGTTLMGCNYSSSPFYGAYYMDGVYVSMSQANPTYSYESTTYQDPLRLTVSVGAPTTNTLTVKPFTSGQFYSPFSLSDAEVKFNFKIDDVDYDKEWLGYSFRMKDRQNGYALETDTNKMELVKYAAGVRTVLAAQDYPLLSQKTYAVKLQTNGSHFAVFLDNTPLIEADDDTYASGRFGYFSNKSFVTFSGLAYKPMLQNDVWSDQYAIWDAGTASADVQYNNIVFSDPENDPPAGGVYDWTVQHTLRFIHNQGVSGLNGKTFHDAQLKFDKVGDYVVSLRAKDDPNPDYLSPVNNFDEYRKPSNAFTKKITVHRRPIADFTLDIAADNKILWTDKSCDPDRYYSSTDYSTEGTGIDYRATRGILQKKFYYVTPSGVYKEAKLVSPQELGTYEVGMAVQDEYGAWSDWDVVLLPVTTLAAPNHPPVPGFTSSHVNTFRGVPVTLNSTAYDVEDGDRTKLPHAYYVKEVSAGAESLQSSSRTDWVKTFGTLGSFNIRQVVQDSEGGEAEFSLQVNIVNRIPGATITVPESSDQNNPTKLTLLRPDFSWMYGDGDDDPQTAFQMKIYRYGGTLEHDSGIKNTAAAHWMPGIDLPEKVNMYAVVRVFDGYDWSPYSAPKYFYIETNRPPEADWDWQSKPPYEGDVITLSQALKDPDHDDLSVLYTVTDPAGVKQTFSSSAKFPYAAAGPSFKGAMAGTYSVKLTVSDGKAPPITVTKNIIVLPLSISGMVKHTELWDLARKASNKKTSGDEESPRAYNVFWAGERFLLRASTTDTATATEASEVKVTMNGITVGLTATNAQRTSWSGEMWDADFEKLPNGPLTFTFKAIYSNGTVKQTTVTIVISGNIQQTVGVHRVH
ncbi:hypothetical protein [Paenibacillus sp. R14(2021)]|uniref:hypothetical protein n=1 Tax=Paenibacillus sp. R14(2021) TaxID=2859228 RepID=UPI001C612018|nr:hypothetical protein [Paenibacillus sp. R14(2021)]